MESKPTTAPAGLTDSLLATLAMREEILDVLSVPPHQRRANKDQANQSAAQHRLASTILSKSQTRAKKASPSLISTSTSNSNTSSTSLSANASHTFAIDTGSVATIGALAVVNNTRTNDAALLMSKSVDFSKRDQDQEINKKEADGGAGGGTRRPATAAGGEKDVPKASTLRQSSDNTTNEIQIKYSARNGSKQKKDTLLTDIKDRIAMDAHRKLVEEEVVKNFMAAEPTLDELRKTSGSRYILEHTSLFRIVRDTYSQYPADAHLRINKLLTEKGYSAADITAFRTAWSEVVTNNEMFGRSKTDPNFKADPSLFAEEFINVVRKRLEGFDELDKWTAYVNELRHKLNQIMDEDQRETAEYEKMRYEVDEEGKDLENYPIDVEPAGIKIEAYKAKSKDRYSELVAIRRELKRIAKQAKQFQEQVYSMPANFGISRTEEDELDYADALTKYQDSCSHLKVIFDKGEHSFWDMHKHYTPIWNLRLPCELHNYRFGKLKMIKRQNNPFTLPLFCSTDNVLGVEIDQENCHSAELDAWETYAYLLDFVWTKEFNPFPKPLEIIHGDGDNSSACFIFEKPDCQPFHSMITAELAIMLRKLPDILQLWCTQLALAALAMDYCEGKLFSPFHYTYNLNITNDGLLLFQDMCILDIENEHMYVNDPYFRYFKKDVFMRRRGFDPYAGFKPKGSNDGVTLDELRFEEALEKEEKIIKSVEETYREDVDSDESDQEDYLNPTRFNINETGYEDKDYDYMERYVQSRPLDRLKEDQHWQQLVKEGKWKPEEYEAKKRNSNANFQLSRAEPTYSFNFANFTPWIYDILQVATASSRVEFLQLQNVTTFHRLGYALKYPQYAFRKEQSVPQQSAEAATATATASSKKGSKNDSIQAYLEDQPVAFQAYQTFTVVTGGELSLELYCGEINNSYLLEYEKVYEGLERDYVNPVDYDGSDTAKLLFNGQFDPEAAYHDLHVVKRVEQLGTYKVDQNSAIASTYKHGKFDGPQITGKINNRNATALMESKSPPEPACACIFNKNGVSTFPSRDINNRKAPPKRYNALFEVTSDVPCIVYLEFSIFISNPKDYKKSQRKTGAAKIQFIPDIPTTPEAQDVLFSLEEYYRTKIPTLIYRSHPFLTAKELWKDSERSKQLIVDGSVAWGKMKRRIQQGQDNI